MLKSAMEYVSEINTYYETKKIVDNKVANSKELLKLIIVNINFMLETKSSFLTLHICPLITQML